MAITPTYVVINSAGVAQPSVDLLLGVANEAFRLWGLALAGNANLSVRIEILTSLPSGRADGTWGNGQSLGTVGGYSLALGAPAWELMTGQNASGSDTDIVIRFQADYLLNELFLDPTPQTRGDTPIDRTDGLSVLLHEIGHALGFTGYWTEATNSFISNFNTPFDQRLQLIGGEAYFNGPNVQAVYGAAVPLTNDNYTHYGNTNAYPGTSTDPLTGLMNGVVYYRGWNYVIGDLDLAFLADMGLGTIRDDILDAPGHVFLRGGLGNDTITGSALDNQLYGDEGDDVVAGGSGNDILVGGIGNDTLSGDADNDYLIGGDGNDTLNGGLGTNTLQGGTGDDLYQVANAADSIVEFASEGVDEVQTALTVFTLPNNIERLTYAGGAVSALLIGSADDNVITGGAGRDDIYGREGNDTLNDGGNNSGNADTMIGGLGDDRYFVGERGSSTIELAGQGYDTVYTSFSIYALQANIEALVATDNGTHAALVGNAIRNEMVGGTGRDDMFGREGDDSLDGGTGAANTLLGQEGNDDYIVRAVGDSVVEFAGQGNDRVLSFIASFVLPDNVERLVSGYSGEFTGIGNGSSNDIQGWYFDDFLSGLDGDDILTGAGGADILVGGSGSDSFRYLGPTVETGYDRILDFTSGVDRILLHASSYGRTATIDFVQGGAPAATSTNSTFLYNVNNGIVSYDVDGTGPGAAIPLAQLNAGMTLVAGDFAFY